MSYYSRLSKSFEGALRLPLHNRTKYVLISDCHRGTGTANDNFLKNQNLYFAALRHYYRQGYTYIELGDGDELWENRSMQQIIEAHDGVFELLSLFHRQNRLYMLYGNHDMIKKSQRYREKNCCTYHCSCCNNTYWEKQPLLPDMKFPCQIPLETLGALRCSGSHQRRQKLYKEAQGRRTSSSLGRTGKPHFDYRAYPPPRSVRYRQLVLQQRKLCAPLRHYLSGNRKKADPTG